MGSFNVEIKLFSLKCTDLTVSLFLYFYTCRETGNTTNVFGLVFFSHFLSDSLTCCVKGRQVHPKILTHL